MLVKFGETLQDDKVYELIVELEKINPEVATIKKLKM
jgi:hypothetical protein